MNPVEQNLTNERVALLITEALHTGAIAALSHAEFVIHKVLRDFRNPGNEWEDPPLESLNRFALWLSIAVNKMRKSRL